LHVAIIFTEINNGRILFINDRYLRHNRYLYGNLDSFQVHIVKATPSFLVDDILDPEVLLSDFLSKTPTDFLYMWQRGMHFSSPTGGNQPMRIEIVRL